MGKPYTVGMAPSPCFRNGSRTGQVMVFMYMVLFNGPSMNIIGEHLTPCCQVLGMCCGWMHYGRCYSCGLLNVQMTIIFMNAESALITGLYRE